MGCVVIGLVIDVDVGGRGPNQMYGEEYQQLRQQDLAVVGSSDSGKRSRWFVWVHGVEEWQGCEVGVEVCGGLPSG